MSKPINNGFNGNNLASKNVFGQTSNFGSQNQLKFDFNNANVNGGPIKTQMSSIKQNTNSKPAENFTIFHMSNKSNEAQKPSIIPMFNSNTQMNPMSISN